MIINQNLFVLAFQYLVFKKKLTYNKKWDKIAEL